MLCVSQRQDDKWGIRDTESKVETFHTALEIEGYLREGKRISGAILLSDGKVIVNKSIAYMDRLDLVKSRLLYGKCSASTGLNFDISDNQVTALEIEESYFNNRVNDLDSDSNSFVLTLPDIVTDLDDGFFSIFSYLVFSETVVIDLPSSLKEIGSGALHSPYVGSTGFIVVFNSIIDNIRSSSSSWSSVYLNEESLNLNNYIIPVRLLNRYSLTLVLKDDRVVKFPYIEEVHRGAVYMMFSKSVLSLIKEGSIGYFVFQFEFGSSLRVLKNFARCGLFNALNVYNVVYLDDCSNFEVIDFSDSGDSFTGIRFYLFVVKKDQVQPFKELFQGKEIDERTAIGIMGYADESEKSYLKSNMNMFFSDTMEYFGVDYCDLVETYKEIELINH